MGSSIPHFLGEDMSDSNVVFDELFDDEPICDYGVREKISIAPRPSFPNGPLSPEEIAKIDLQFTVRKQIEASKPHSEKRSNLAEETDIGEAGYERDDEDGDTF
jgi:hypothetical protein